MTNGELLEAAEKAAFDVFITCDKDYLGATSSHLALIVLRPRWCTMAGIAPLVTDLQRLLTRARPGMHEPLP